MATLQESLRIVLERPEREQLLAAEEFYRQVLQWDPGNAEALHYFGVMAHQLGKHEVAAEYLGRAIRTDSRQAVYHFSLGLVHAAQRRVAEAAASFGRAIELQPGFADAHHHLGILHAEQGKLDPAIACFLQTIQLDPGYAEAHNNLGVARLDQGRFDEAANCFERALELQPKHADIHVHLGLARRDQGRLDEAIECFQRAIECDPDQADAHNSLGMLWMLVGKLDQAAISFDRAIEIRPAMAEAHWNRALLWLLVGDYERGWPEYEWRWGLKDCPPRPRFSQPLWDGRPLAGRTILLYAEQGFGDAIQFIRYASLAKQSGGKVIVACHKPLAPLLARCRGVDQSIGQDDPLPPFDVQAPLLSLPRILGTRLETIPADVPYLSADPELVERWRERLAGIGGFKVGIVWQGNPALWRDRYRSIPLAHFAPLAEVPEVSLISLQKEAGTEQLDRLGFGVVGLEPFDEEPGALADRAAIMKNLDLVISSDTGLAHLAGALGVPVWVALSLAPDWRYLLDRDDSPWYPTMRLFRQPRFGDWGAVFLRIKTVLMQVPR